MTSRIDECFDDPDAWRIVGSLDAIPGAYERTQEGLAQARAGSGIPLDELDERPGSPNAGAP